MRGCLEVTALWLFGMGLSRFNVKSFVYTIVFIICTFVPLWQYRLTENSIFILTNHCRYITYILRNWILWIPFILYGRSYLIIMMWKIHACYKVFKLYRKAKEESKSFTPTLITWVHMIGTLVYNTIPCFSLSNTFQIIKIFLKNIWKRGVIK